MTPSYLFPEDAKHFHSTLQKACDAHSPTHFSKFKAWCDTYFTIKHRGGESRGIGGIFFDDLGGDPEECFAFAQECGEAFLPAYEPIIKKRLAMPFTEREKRWQGMRRVSRLLGRNWIGTEEQIYPGSICRVQFDLRSRD